MRIGLLATLRDESQALPRFFGLLEELEADPRVERLFCSFYENDSSDDTPECLAAWLKDRPGVLQSESLGVPRLRGREISRVAAEIEDEVRSLAAQGIREVTLLGQTVNAYGRHDVRRGKTAAAGTMPFAELLARLDAIPGIERIRYTSPHPLFYDDALIRAHGTLERLCPHVHLPVQSGSDRILDAMRRRYTRAEYLSIVTGLRAPGGLAPFGFQIIDPTHRVTVQFVSGPGCADLLESGDPWPTPHPECTGGDGVAGEVAGLGITPDGTSRIGVSIVVDRPCYEQVEVGTAWPTDFEACLTRG